MSEKQASSEIAESRERFEKWAINGDWESEQWEFLFAAWQAAEQDTRERLAQPKMMWGWDIEEIKSAMRQFQSKHPGKLPSEIEQAERIRGKE